MIHNCITNTLDRFSYIDNNSYFINSPTGAKTLVYGDRKIRDNIFNIGTKRTNVIIMNKIEFSNHNLEQIERMCKTYSPKIIYTPGEILANLAKRGKLNRTSLNEVTSFGAILDNVKEFKKFSDKIGEYKVITKDISSVIIKSYHDTEDINKILTNFFRFNLKEIVCITKDPYIDFKYLEKETQLNKILINLRQEIPTDNVVKNLTLQGKRAGVLPPFIIRELNSKITKWGKVYINTLSHHWGSENISSDGGKFSNNNTYYDVVIGYTKHLTLEEELINKVIIFILNKEELT